MSQIKEKPLRLTELARLPHTLNSERNEWRMCCPVHGGNNPTAFCLSLTSGLYHCFACGAGGRLLEFWERGKPAPQIKTATASLLLTENRQKVGVVRRAGTGPAKAPYSNPPTGQTTSRGLLRMKVAQTRLALLDCNPDGGGKEAQTVLNYLKHMGISLETALKAGVGYEPAFSFTITDTSGRTTAHTLSNQWIIAPALLFPLYDPATGDFLNFYARGINPPSLRLHYVGHGSKGLFNAGVVKLTSSDLAHLKEKQDQKVAPLLVVEGVFDALAWMEAGYGRVTALIGTSLLKAQWFTKAGPVMLAFDNDRPGKLAQEKARQILTGMGIFCSSLDPQFYQGHKDFAELWNWDLSRRDKLGSLTQILQLSSQNFLI